MRIRQIVMALVLWASPALSQENLYRTNFAGEFGIVNPSTGDFTVLGTPGDGNPVSGLCADTTGRVFGSRRISMAATDLIEIDRSTGARIATIGTIKDGSNDMRITDLACQPGTGVIFALDNSSFARLFTIDKTTAAATLVGVTGVARGGLAFGPDGRLFVATTSNQFAEISPANGATIGMIKDAEACLDGLAIRASDYRPFASQCGDDGGQLYRIDPTTGGADVVGDMGDYGTDLEFIVGGNPAPTMSQAALLTLALVLCGAAARRIRRAREAP